MDEESLSRAITIRGESHSVPQAISREVTHVAFHVGQIVYIARYFCGDSWESLSIPVGKSEEYNRRKLSELEK
ncbi:MAG: DUF1572 family protein [Bdellovibrionales bacterium]|nr:DUF1572 family protein [Bdellovibrionales bacterium]